MLVSSHLTDAVDWAAMTDEKALEHMLERSKSICSAWAEAEGELFALLAERAESHGEVQLADTYALAAERLVKLSWRLGRAPFWMDKR